MPEPKTTIRVVVGEVLDAIAHLYPEEVVKWANLRLDMEVLDTNAHNHDNLEIYDFYLFLKDWEAVKR